MLYEEGRCQRRDNGHGDDDGIDVVGDDSERESETCDNEGKLTYLCQRAAAVHRVLETLAGEEYAERREEQLADDRDKRDNDDRDDVFNDH